MRTPLFAAHCVLVCLGISAGAASAFELKPNGRFHFDYARHDDDVRPLQNRDFVRRAVFGLDGKFNADWSFEVAYDFTGGGEFNDAYVRYDGWKQGAISAGQFKVPFGLETLTSSNSITFIERALPIGAFSPSRRTGVGFNRNGDKYTFAVMGFDSSLEDDGGRGAGARFTYAPVNKGNNVVHAGIAATTEKPEDGVNFRTYPESRPTSTRFVRTGNLADVERVNQLGLELAWKSGPFSTQAEWMRANLNRSGISPNADLGGWYVNASWILTGESRSYKNGRFRGIKPARKSGAWEIATRYSHVDLNDDGVSGGRERNITVGVNWYAKDYVRIMANYIKVKSERRGISDNPNIFLVRAQLDF
jgi:phosphate-selective porin OprO/OprP